MRRRFQIPAFCLLVAMVHLAWADDTGSNSGLQVSRIDFGDHEPGGKNEVSIDLQCLSESRDLRLECLLSERSGRVLAKTHRSLHVRRGESLTAEIPYKLPDPGDYRLDVLLKEGAREILRKTEMFSLSRLHSSDYGCALPSQDPVRLWWCDANRKVSRTRPLPAQRSRQIEIQCAGNEFESFQIVLNPDRPLLGVQVQVEDLVSPAHTLSSEEIQVCEVAYLKVEHPSDHTGCVGWWPDPLPPLQSPLPLDLLPHQNQPLWFTVHVPAGTPAGIYVGRICLSSDDWFVQVPVRLRVWGFDLPARPSLESAFGLGAGSIWRYQNVKEEHQAQVWDLWMQNFRDHRIAPYGFALSGIECAWEKDPVSGEPLPRLHTDAWDEEAKRCLDGYGFSSFRLGLEGLGGDEKDFRGYCQALQNHLQERGWLDKAYIYWFDEPRPDDYPAVRKNMEQIKRCGPGFRRMLTEQPESALFGAVDIWCPLISAYVPEACRARQDLGEKVWWYVCTVPKAPYPGLFIDHDALEMRLWIWMTWKYGVEGILVWQTTYWSSPTAFPNSLQNPWEDPMGYQTGYGLKEGDKVYWGNGDGRFLYPANRNNDGEEYALGPVSSIRWELLREGMEDYEYFKTLERKIQEAAQRNESDRLLSRARDLLILGEDIIQDPRVYTRDPSVLLDHRARVAEMIERLSQ